MSVSPIRERLRDVPWRALEGLSLEEPVSRILSGEGADRVLERFLKTLHPSPPDTRRAVAETLFGVSLWRRRLAARLGVEWAGAAPGQLIRAFLADLGGQVDASEPLRDEALLSFAEAHSLPDWLANEMRRAVPEDELEAFAQALNVPGPVCLRVNRVRTTREALAQRLAAEGVTTRPCASSPLGLIADGRPNILGLAAHHDGWFEVQDEGSQLLGLRLGARPGDRVLDLCAGAGGKTLLVAGELRNTGELHAYDSDAERLGRLATRAERAGAQVRVHYRGLPADLRVDQVLVDAPCSELGALRRGPDVRWRLSPADFASHPDQQLALCETALAHLAPGGTLVYATCTFREEENRAVCRAFESRYPHVRSVGNFFETWPHRQGTDAFFAAVYRV